MEMTGVSEAVQVAQLILMFMEKGFNVGIETFHLGGSLVEKSFNATKTVAAHFYKRYKDDERNPNKIPSGEKSIKDMIDLCNKKKIKPMLMQIDKEELEGFKKYAKDNLLSYTILPDLNSKDDYMEIMYPSSQAAIYDIYLDINADKAKPYSFSQYRDAARAEDVRKMSEELGEEYMYLDEACKAYMTSEDREIEQGELLIEEGLMVSPERLAKLPNEKYSIVLTDSLGNECSLILDSYKVSINKDNVELHLGDREIVQFTGLNEITIDKGTLLISETDTEYFTKVPGSRGKEYIVIKKEDTSEINSGKTIKSKLDADTEYDICDRNGNFVRKISGKDLCDGHYARVLTDVKDIIAMNKYYVQQQKGMKNVDTLEQKEADKKSEPVDEKTETASKEHIEPDKKSETAHIEEIQTNMGSMPVSDYREIVAMQNGFDSYEDMYNQGYCLDDVNDKVPEKKSEPAHDNKSNNAFIEVLPSQLTRNDSKSVKVHLPEGNLYVYHSSVIKSEGHVFVCLNENKQYKLFDAEGKLSDKTYTAAEIIEQNINYVVSHKEDKAQNKTDTHEQERSKTNGEHDRSKRNSPNR